MYAMDIPNIFERTVRLVGEDGLQHIAARRVILFGVGGVGSWCAEALVRSGISRLVIVDPDAVDPSNVNRQLPALVSTVGQPKVEVMRQRLLAINPQAHIVALQQRYSLDTAAEFPLEEFDYVIDAIDSMADKLELILRCTPHPSTAEGRVPVLFSSMGAARKMDPLQVRVSEFWRVDGCPLAASLRRRMRRSQRYPGRRFQCVWSPERVEAAQTGGTLMPVTATFGLVLASLVVRHATATD